jgi:hypothetical protein
MNIFRKIIKRIKWWKSQRVFMKAIRKNFKSIKNECKIASLKYDSDSIPIKFYGKILKQSRAKRNIIPYNRASDLYDKSLSVMYKTTQQLGILHSEKRIKLSDINMSCNEVYKSLKRALVKY